MHKLGGWFLLVFILFYYCIYQLEIKIIIIWRRIKKLKDSVLFLGIIRVESTKWENYYYLVECATIPLRKESNTLYMECIRISFHNINFSWIYLVRPSKAFSFWACRELFLVSSLKQRKIDKLLKFKTKI